MVVDKQAIVSVLELVFYIPSLIAAAIVCKRHGFSRGSGWLFTLILCMVRIVGSSCQLATYHFKSEDLLRTVVILESVGLSPLLLATLGLLLRCANSPGSQPIFHTVHFRLVQLMVSIAMALSIVGGTKSISSNGTYQPQPMSKVSAVLYLVALIAMAAMALITATTLPSGSKDDTRLVRATIFAIPLIAIRLAYTFLGVFSHNKHFSLVSGSVVIRVFMAILEEFVVVVMYIIVGWMTDVLTPEARDLMASRSQSGSSGGQEAIGGGGRRLGGRRQGPIYALVNHQKQQGRTTEQGWSTNV